MDWVVFGVLAVLTIAVISLWWHLHELEAELGENREDFNTIYSRLSDVSLEIAELKDEPEDDWTPVTGEAWIPTEHSGSGA